MSAGSAALSAWPDTTIFPLLAPCCCTTMPRATSALPPPGKTLTDATPFWPNELSVLPFASKCMTAKRWSVGAAAVVVRPTAYVLPFGPSATPKKRSAVVADIGVFTNPCAAP